MIDRGAPDSYEWSIGDVTIDGPLVLGPMAGYTSLALRLLCRRAGAHLVCSEMVAAQGLAHGNRKTLRFLATCPEEKPVAMQIFGAEPQLMADVVPLLEDAGADIIDINMGCPVPKVVKSLGGAALMADPDRAVAIAAAVVDRAKVPVMCKIRAGRYQGDTSHLDMALRLQSVGVAAIAVHARTAQQGFSGPADHSRTRELVQALEIPVLASGDVFAPSAPTAILQDTGCAAVMIARGAIGRPWVFAQANAVLSGQQPPPDPSPAARFGLALCQAQIMTLQTGEESAMREMRGCLAWYTKGLPNSARLRQQFNQAESLGELAKLMTDYVRLQRTVAL